MADSTVPDIYCDGVMFTINPFSMTLVFQLTLPSQVVGQVHSGVPQVIVRMSPQHAKAMTMMLKKTIKQFELETLGDYLKLPPQVLASYGVNPEEW